MLSCFPSVPQTRLESLVKRVRTELGDLESSFQETVISTGDTNRYVLNRAPMNAASVQVWIDGLNVTDAVCVEEATGTLIFDAVPIKDAVITASGLSYRFFTNEELGRICQDAAGMHTRNRSDQYGRPLTLDNLDEVEMYPLSLLCTMNALYVLATDSSFDIDIQAPDGMVVPRSQRYRQLMEMIDMLRGRYEELSKLLNIGLYAIEVFTFRRISKRTNRYVPVYRPQEIDDRSRPQRLYLPIPTYGAKMPDDGIPDFDLVINQGDTFSQEIVLEQPLPPEAQLRAQIRGFAGSPVIAAEFGILPLPLDKKAGSKQRVIIALSSDQTRNLPLNAVWDLQLTIPKDGPDYVKTLVRGRVHSPRDVTKPGGYSGEPTPINYVDDTQVSGVITQTAQPADQGQGYMTTFSVSNEHGYEG